MPVAVITDASCIILLDKIGRIDLLQKLYGNLLLTPEVAKEFGGQLPQWFTVSSPDNSRIQRVVQANLDLGEASSIALAMEHSDYLLILDDLKARKFAASLGLDFTGTLGVVLAAKLAGIIPSVQQVLDEIRQTNFRISPALDEQTL